MLMMSVVNVFLPNLFSVSSVYMIYPPRLIYISTSLFDVLHARRLFSRVFSLLCLFVLCFLQYSFTLSVWSRVFIGAFFYWCISCVAKHTTSSVWSYPSGVHYCFFNCVSLCCVEYDLDKYSIWKPFSPVITTFISRNKCSIIRIQALRWFELSGISTHLFSTDISIVMLAWSIKRRLVLFDVFL